MTWVFWLIYRNSKMDSNLCTTISHLSTYELGKPNLIGNLVDTK